MKLTDLPEHDKQVMNEALARFNAGDLPAAEALFRDILSRFPAMAGLYNNLGVILRKSGQVDAAEAAYKQAQSLEPTNADAAYNLGNLVRDRGDKVDARRLFEIAVASEPDHGGAWTNLGGVLRDLTLYDESFDALQHALRLQPDHADTHNNLGVTLWKMKRHLAAVAHYRRAIALTPTDARYRANIGVCLMDIERYEEAETHLREAISLDPKNPDPIGFLGQCLTGVGRFDEALELFESAFALSPDHLDSNLGRARALLLKGDMAQGWPAYAWRWRREETREMAVADNHWRGEELTGKHIHVAPEQGVGDVIQFLRYIPLLEKRGAQVSVTVPDALRRMAASVSPKLILVSDSQPAPKADFTANLLDLPEQIGTRLDTVPADVPYMFIPTEARRPLTKRAGAMLHAGLVWAGNPQHKRDAQRSVPLWRMAEILRVPGIAWYSLQKGDRSADRRRLGLEAVLPDVVDEAEDFADTANIIDQLDLVVTVDTSVAHLAGALGKPVWVLIQYAPDWRWLIETNETPWYPSMRLFRMGRHQDLSALHAALIDRTRQVPAGRTDEC